MRQLNYIKTRTLEWHDVREPSLPSDEGALVRPYAVSTCDFDGVAIQGQVPLRGPVPVGHEGVGEVIEVGDAVRGVKPGDQVIIPWKISCGQCEKCRLGLTAHCVSMPFEAAYSWGPTAREWGGFLADLVAVPFADHMLCPLPAGLDPLAAAPVSDNLTDAWRAVAPALEERPGGRVLILGGAGPGSVGVVAAGFAGLLGASEVVYLDRDTRRREVAERHYGARVIDDSAGFPDQERLEGQFDVLVDGAAIPEGLEYLLRRAGPNAIVTCLCGQAYRRSEIGFPVYEMFRNAVNFRTGWNHTRGLMEQPLALLAEGRFDPRVVETASVPFDDAAEALVEPFTKLSFSREL